MYMLTLELLGKSCPNRNWGFWAGFVRAVEILSSVSFSFSCVIWITASGSFTEKKKEKSLFFSPYSLSVATFWILLGGAYRQTRTHKRQPLHFLKFERENHGGNQALKGNKKRLLRRDAFLSGSFENARCNIFDELPCSIREPSYSNCLLGLARRLSQGCLAKMPLRNCREERTEIKLIFL